MTPHHHKSPWRLNDEQWRAVLDAARSEAPRNRAMLALDAPVNKTQTAGAKPVELVD